MSSLPCQRSHDLIRKYSWRLVVMCIGFLVALCLVSVERSQAALYWGTGADIARANLDGSLAEPAFIRTGGSGLCALAVDSSYIYWADSDEGTIGRANLDGSGVEDDFIIVGSDALPCGVAVDSNFIYWPNMGTDTIGRARLNGSEVNPAFIASVQHPCAVAVSPAGLYWASDDERDIWRSDLGSTSAPELVVDEAGDPCGIALTDSHLFWVNSDAGTIERANLDGSQVMQGFIGGGHYPVSLGIHGGQLYWVNIDRGFESIGRANLDGTAVNQAFISGLELPYSLTVNSVQVTPTPPIGPPDKSRIKIGKLRRLDSGSVLFPIDLPGDGRLEAAVRGAKVRVLPAWPAGHAILKAGRTWLKITPTSEPGNGNRCAWRILKRGGKVKLALRLLFVEFGKTATVKRRRFYLFKLRRRPGAQKKPNVVSAGCLALM